MCGILGGVGRIDYHEYLLKGLSVLEYRGYDSTGLVYVEDTIPHLYKAVGKVEALESIVPVTFAANMGIAHTRWATHGKPTVENAHPQVSFHKKLYLVHNGVIENSDELKKTLLENGYKFSSTTDTEVIVNLLEYFQRQGMLLLQAINEAIKLLKGSYACALINIEEEDRLYFFKKASPLMLGKGHGSNYLASDPYPMASYTNEFLDLEDGDYGYMDKNGIHLYRNGKEVTPVFENRSYDFKEISLGDYPHYMIKEIDEIPEVIKRIKERYCPQGSPAFDQSLIKELSKAKRLRLIGSGSSYHACKMGVKYFRDYGIPCSCSIASEWGYDPYDIKEDQFFILLSQSGETADLLRCERLIKEAGKKVLAITNAKGSALERKANYHLDLLAGREISVASTKAYIAEDLILLLLAKALSGKKSTHESLSTLIEALDALKADQGQIKQKAETLKDISNAFLIGKGGDYLSCLEGALKLKEVAYVHAEALPGGELKHGPLALLDEKSLLLASISESSTASACRANVSEAASRGVKTLIFSSKDVGEKGDAYQISIKDPQTSYIALVVCYFYFAYYLALNKGLPIDRPKNLAKAVTSE